MSDWSNGWQEGHAEGFIAGRCSGYKDGFAEGKVNGKHEANEQLAMRNQTLQTRSRMLNVIGLGSFVAGYGFHALIQWIIGRM